MPVKTIGTAAAELGLNPKTLRYYERLGLVSAPARSTSGYRLYDDAAVTRLAFIAKVKDLGLTLREIRGILRAAGGGAQPCASVRTIIQTHVARVDHEITRLRAVRKGLRALLAGWRGGCGNGAAAAGPGAVCPRLEAYVLKAPGRRSAPARMIGNGTHRGDLKTKGGRR